MLDKRAHAVRELLAKTRASTHARDGRIPDLSQISADLARLAANAAWFTFDEFPVDLERVTTFYRLAEDADGAFALYVSASVPGRKQLPHDHTTWAVIAGIRGQEKNVVYRRTPGGTPGEVKLSASRTVTVGPAQVVALAPEDLHSTEIVGAAPALHLHFYGLSQELMFDRVRYDDVAGGHPVPVPVPTRIRHPLVTPETLHGWTQGAGELALVDVRTEAEYATGHLLHASNVPLANLVARIGRLVPGLETPVVVLDANEELAHLAAATLVRLGYGSVSVLRGGTGAWEAAGYPLFEGVHVPGKALAEQAQRVLGIPEVDVAEFHAWRAEGRPLFLLDVRPFDEYRRYSIPGSINCPAADLALRLPALDLAPSLTVVVHCAGRARSLVAAQTLIAAGVPQRVYALRNGTMSWELEGGELKSDQQAFLPLPSHDERPEQAARRLAEQRVRATSVARRAGLDVVDDAALARLREEFHGSVYLFDIRLPGEFEAGHAAGSVNAPGGQLIHTLDAYAPVRGARLVLVDWDGVRAAYIGAWLAALGRHDVSLWRPSSATPLVTGATPALKQPELHPAFSRALTTAAPPSAHDAWRGPHSLTDPQERHEAFIRYLEWEAGLIRQLSDAGETELNEGVLAALARPVAQP
ncbi:rhodanese-like domain-containing protein [Bordetella genomosp. 10]|uniref:rhodanese-like domain-containing protein n=1 Tax=Bordetella genomosp. 10 TaxID=1416804 RepID=UPI0015C60FE8|nr:rhodanese-like domain-containing protein [Bordetella genomosp. 10]